MKKITAFVLAMALIFPGAAFAQVKLVKPTGDVAADFAAATGRAPAAAGQTSGFCDLLKLLPSCQAMPLEDIWKKILAPQIKADLTYAKLLADNAATPGSKLRSACYDAVLKANAQANGDAIKNTDGTPAVMPDPAVVSKLEQGAELIDNLQPTAPVMAGCAAAAQAVKVTAIQFVTGMVTLVGAKVATGGAL